MFYSLDHPEDSMVSRGVFMIETRYFVNNGKISAKLLVIIIRHLRLALFSLGSRLVCLHIHVVKTKEVQEV